MHATKSLRAILAGGVCALAIAGAAHAQSRDFNVPAGDLQAALDSYAQQAGIQLLYKVDLVKGVPSKGAHGMLSSDEALAMLLSDTGLAVRHHPSGAVAIVSASDPQSGSAAGDGADQGTVAALIVTAQKKEEAIQDVPIAISAFTERSLQEQKIEGGYDLLKAIPNVTFSKNNFSGYNFSIRGIGTKAVSVTTDPGVSVEFNSTAFIRNRLFEQEYFDVERVEVLRGPQGTLHGRNATAGVINVISAKPNLHEFSGWLKGEVGNYHTKRVSAVVNVPLVEDKLAVRIAGALTDRAGYDFNATTHNAVNGRDLWSGRITVAFNPTENIRSNLVWERFNEDDNRSRTGKQLCHRDPGLDHVGSVTFDISTPQGQIQQATTSQGCLPGSLYDNGAFGTPNGLSLPAMLAGMTSFIGYKRAPIDENGDPVPGTSGLDNWAFLLNVADPYGGAEQSHDLRVINSFRDPKYQAMADLLEFNVDVDLSPSLTLTSTTAYDRDHYYSFQDYNRFNTQPVFNNSSGLFEESCVNGSCRPVASNDRALTPGGVFCDPQLGCSNTIAGFDISRAKSKQFSQEIRLSSSFNGPLNFTAGANYLTYNTVEDYFVLFNVFTALAEADRGPFFLPIFNYSPDPTKCVPHDAPFYRPDGTLNLVDIGTTTGASATCIYIDPNPLESINGQGHNYFRSKNPYRLKSWSTFGEAYWDVTSDVRLTAGLRYNDDRKQFTLVPSQLLLGKFLLAGTTGYGYPETGRIKQHWGEWTGRLGVDWKPDLSFTDQTLVYAFYSRGYKGGGANPPGIGFSTDLVGGRPVIQTLSYPPTFEPEFVNAYEVGTKNTLLGGALTANLTTFYYDYSNYQVSQIKDRTAVNENFDAKVWGLELESMFSPSRNLRLTANLGYQDSRIAAGEQSIDLMDRVKGHEGYILARPWVQFPSNCVLPISYIEEIGRVGFQACPGWFISIIDHNDPRLPNQGQGFFADLGGNQLPNAPHWTVSLGAQYGWDFLENWRATVRTDAYWQSQSWARVYNDNPYDKLHGWYNVNLSFWVERNDGLKIELYAKNLLDKTPITDAFLNSDDSDLTTNVFVLDPRLIGLSIKKDF